MNIQAALQTIEFRDVDATYYLNGAHVEAIVRGDTKQTIFADSFVNAKAAVKARIEREKAADIEAAWSAR